MLKQPANFTITNVNFPYPDRFEHGSISVNNGKIEDVSISNATHNKIYPTLDLKNKILLPGFIDMHIHGCMGYDAMDGTVDSIISISKQLVKTGVTSFLPTTYAGSDNKITETLLSIKSAMSHESLGAEILGAHLEGPYINMETRGSQPESYIRHANPYEYEKWLKLGIIKEVTVAPEINENTTFVKECLKHKIVVSIGHSNATYSDIVSAVNLGVKQVTHLFNGMRGLHHREPGIVGAALLFKNLSCEIIADSIHLHPAIIKLILLIKGIDKSILVTDSVSAAGLPDGEYLVLDNKVKVDHGKIINLSGTLCGSSLTMDNALRNVISISERPVEELWPITSRNAARQLNIKKGEIKLGYDADFVILNKNYEVEMTIISGNILYENNK